MGELADKLRMPRAFLGPSILLMVAEGGTHGYDLMSRVEEMGLHRSAVYRELRALEEAGLVTSVWDQATRGPMKRTYTVTDAGRQELLELASAAAELGRTMEDFVRRWALTVE